MDEGIISSRLVPKVLESWRNPEHECFGDRNLWSLSNAFTERLKTVNPFELPKRTMGLHKLLDPVAVDAGQRGLLASHVN